MRGLTAPMLAVGVVAGSAMGSPDERIAGHEQATKPRIFQASNLSLTDASRQAEPLVGKRLQLQLEASHPVRKRKASLTMTVDEPNDLLNALAAAYGLRWLKQPGERVVFVDKRDYRMRGPGLRQSLADALPPELRSPLEGEPGGRLARLESILKDLEARSEAPLTAATAAGPVTLDRLDPALSRPLLTYLNSFTAYKLGNMCDEAAKELATNPGSRFHYGANPKGTRQFSFQLGNGWIAVRPE